MGDSKLEEILKKEKPSVEKPPNSQPDLRTTLERELEGEDQELAKELQRSRAEEIIARRRIAIERMRGGQGVHEAEGRKVQERGKEWLTDVAQGLLERGLDPSVVGRTIDYLLGNAQSPMVGFPGGAAPAQGMTFTDMKEIFKMGQENNRTDPAITSILDKLTQKLETIEGKVLHSPPAPIDPLTQIEQTVATYKRLKEVGMVGGSESKGEGESIEVVKEKHRHEEKMEEITNERKFKEKLGDIAEEIPVNLGKGWAAENASRQRSGGKASSPSTEKDSVSSFPCKKCGATIFVPPDIPEQIKCSKCGQVYQSQETPEPEPAPPPQKTPPVF